MRTASTYDKDVHEEHVAATAFRARSIDAAGNIGAWSARQCRTTPVDDRSTRVSAD